MNVWIPHCGRVTRRGEPVSPESAKDNCDVGWRAFHNPSNSALPIKFGRELDAKRACELLGDRAATITDPFEVRDIFLAEFGTFEELKKYLVSNCCAW